MSKINGDKKRDNLRSRKQTKMREKMRAIRATMNSAPASSVPAKAVPAKAAPVKVAAVAAAPAAAQKKPATA